MKLVALYPVYVRDFGVGYACGSILEAMKTAGASVELHCVTTDAWSHKTYHRCALPPKIKRLGFRVLGPEYFSQLTAKNFVKALKPGDTAYLWPGTPLDVYYQVKEMGNRIVTEFINTHCATGLSTVRSEQIANNVKPLSLSRIQQEALNDDLRIALSDFIFSPSPEVTKSLVMAGAPKIKIIESSYGLKSSDIIRSEKRTIKSGSNKIVGLFVGRVGLRKGAHLLLDYWHEAELEGTLRVVGSIEEEAKAIIQQYADQRNVEFYSFKNDLLPLYRDADVFLFPSLEEGSPLVTYLALGAGLTSIVSPMGSGGAIEDGIEGKVIEPHNRKAWIKGLKCVFGNAETREYYSTNARKRAEAYLWPAIGQRRYVELSKRLSEST